MKRYLIMGALCTAAVVFAQNYPSDYSKSGYGYSQSGYGSADDFDDEFYSYAYKNFPDNYYYEYPSDYYPVSYYENYYNDYRRSIANIDWQRLAVEFRLSNYQFQQIMALNNRFNSFSAWNSYYGMNPDRWYYDRFYALQRILGPQIFVIIQNRYYGGQNPYHYFENYRRTYYQPRYLVTPRYRSVNINHFRIDRDRFFQNRGNHSEWLKAERRNRSGFPGRNDAFSRTESFPQNNRDGFRNGANRSEARMNREENRFRNENRRENPSFSNSSEINSGWRNNGTKQVPRTEKVVVQPQNSSQRSNSGMRGSHGGFR